MNTERPFFDHSKTQEHLKEKLISVKVDAVLNKIPNGLQLYNKNALFNVTVRCLAQGADPIVVIGRLFETIQVMQDMMDDLKTKHNE